MHRFALPSAVSPRDAQQEPPIRTSEAIGTRPGVMAAEAGKLAVGRRTWGLLAEEYDEPGRAPDFKPQVRFFSGLVGTDCTGLKTNVAKKSGVS